MRPIISIIIPCYNRDLFIGEAIESALRQPYDNKEVIVVDDGSTDLSWAIIRSYGNSVIAIKSENGGVSAARNRGIEAAFGDYVVFLDSDDRLEPGALGFYAEALRSDTKTILIGKCRHIDEHGSPCRSDMHQLPNHLAFSPLHELQILSGWASNWACLIPKNLLKAIGGYNTRLSLGEDYDLNLRLLDAGAVFVPIEKVTYQFRVHDSPKLTRNVSGERYGSMCQLFRRAWVSRRDAFGLPENRESRVRLGRWVWSLGRTSYRAGLRDVGDQCIELAVEIAGNKARAGSALVRAAYSLLKPHLVERLAQILKAQTAYCGRLKGVVRWIWVRC
jgi:glycosyltransferase involved in cell wall biosynthesis